MICADDPTLYRTFSRDLHSAPLEICTALPWHLHMSAGACTSALPGVLVAPCGCGDTRDVHDGQVVVKRGGQAWITVVVKRGSPHTGMSEA